MSDDVIDSAAKAIWHKNESYEVAQFSGKKITKVNVLLFAKAPVFYINPKIRSHSLRPHKVNNSYS